MKIKSVKKSLLKSKAQGAINTSPDNPKELREMEALAENLYEQQRKATKDINKIAQSTGD